MPAYKVLFRPSALKGLGKIPEPHRARLAAAIRDLAFDLRPHGCTKLAGQELHRVRVGTYRVVYAIDDTNGIVTVTKTAHRKESYRP